MGTGVIYQWFGDEDGPAAGSGGPSNAAELTSAGAAPTNGNVLSVMTRDFDATTDEYLRLVFALPSNYSSGGTLTIRWCCTGATTNNVVWKTAYCVLHPNSEGSPTDIDAASYGTVTSQTATAVPTTAGQWKSNAYDLGVSGAHASDLLAVYLGRDADAGGDTCTVDARLIAPWSLSFTTA